MKSIRVSYIVATVALLIATGDALSVPRSIGGEKIITRPAATATAAATTTTTLKMTAADVPRGGEGGGTATIPNEVFNLVKSIVGAGVLSLPAGTLAFVHELS
jgi:hypothetical protein